MVTTEVYNGPDREAAWKALIAARSAGAQVSYSEREDPDTLAHRYIVVSVSEPPTLDPVRYGHPIRDGSSLGSY
jgi:hypothetical protein